MPIDYARIRAIVSQIPTLAPYMVAIAKRAAADVAVSVVNDLGRK
jgi:hypothetical protein